MESLFHTIQQADPIWAYTLLFLSSFVENIFPPIPGDTVTVVGAYLVGRNILNFWGVYISTTLGSLLGFMGIFGISYWLEWKVIDKYQPKWVAKTHLDRVEAWFNKYGYWVILFNRFLTGVRSVISLVAGLSKMEIMRVSIYAFTSCAIWNGGLIYLGVILGRNMEIIVELLRLYNRVVLTVVLGLIFIYLIYRNLKKKK